ncbi:MAG: hypothetical protein JXR95_11235 [Deltaproteobacteria bacterium]|nr:hypothetical protein [Deltaproteobacteria bacterium]
MRLKLKIFSFWLVIAMSSLVVSTASAQGAGVASPVTREKAIIKNNPFQLKNEGFSGMIDIFAGYDSNINYAAGDSTSIYEGTVGGLAFLLNPSIRFTTSDLSKRFNSSSKLAYGVEASILYRQYYNTATVDNIFNEPRFGASLGGELYYKPSDNFKIQLFEKGTRYSEPHYLFSDTYTQTWYQNALGIGMLVVPGGGLLEMVLRYELNLNIFEDATLSAGNRMGHRFGFRASYKFFPYTMVWFSTTYDIWSYFDNSARGSMPLRLYGGVSTPITTSLALTLGGGYGWGFYNSGNSPSTWLALGSLTYTLVNKLKLGFNYNHTFEDSVIGSFSDEQNFSLTAYYQPYRTILFQSSLGFRLMNYYDIYYENGGTGDSTRTDTILYATFSGQYRFSNNLTFGVNYRFMMDSTPYRVTTSVQTIYPDSAGSIVNNPSYMKHEIFLTGTYYF